MERQLIEEFVATGQVRFEYRHYLVVDCNVGGNESRRAAEASECAGEQGDFWNYHAIVFANWNGEGEGAFSDRRLKAFAAEIGLDTQAFNACFDAGRYANDVRADEALGRQLGVSRTPTLFINGQLVDNAVDMNEIRTRVQALLGGQ